MQTTATDLVAAGVLACFFSFFFAFAIGRVFRELVPERQRGGKPLWAVITLALSGAAGGWAIFRVALRILWNAMGGSA